MIDIKVYREYWEGVQKRIPEIKKVLPVTIDEEMSKTIQGLSKEECPVLFILIPSGTGASLSADNVRENNLCVIFLMSKYDPQRKGAYETIEEVQPVMERIKQMLIEDSATIIRKTKCFDFWERNVLFPKTKRSFFRTPKHPLPCPFPLNFSLLIITKKFGNLAKNRYICIV